MELVEVGSAESIDTKVWAKRLPAAELWSWAGEINYGHHDETNAPHEFIQEFLEMHSVVTVHFGVFPIMIRGIHIWMLLRPIHDSKSIFRVNLPCRDEDRCVNNVMII